MTTLLFALLALASLPLAAGADSSGVQYENGPAGACGSSPCENGNVSAPKGSGSSQPGTASSSGSGQSSTADEGTNAADNESHGSQKQKGHTGDKTEGKGGKSKASKQNAASPAVDQDDDDGSSPWVPILIAIAVLAAISVGAVIYRRRHQQSDEDPPVRP